MSADPTVRYVERHTSYEQDEQQRGRLAYPPLDEAEASTEEVTGKDNHRGPACPSEGIVEKEGVPAHAAYPGSQGAKYSKPRDEAGEEDGLTPVALEKPLRAGQAFGCDQDIAAPAQDEWASPLAAHPIADLVSDYRSKYAEKDRVSHVHPALLGENT